MRAGRWVAGALAAGGGLLAARRAVLVREVPAGLRSVPLWVPYSIRGPLTLRVARWLFSTPTPVREGVEVRQVTVPSDDGTAVPVLVHTPPGRETPSGALLWMHGGGYVIGTAGLDNASCSEIAAELGTVVAAVDYRLAPEHPFPAGLEDCYAALTWLVREATFLGVDPARIAVGGSSAGAGVAAALAQLARDRGEVTPCFQLLRYPMLDDRTRARRRHLAWTPRSNRYAWDAYLGGAHGPESSYAVPARMRDLRGLPPAWIAVGDLDLFHDEDVAYAERLAAADVPVELHVEPGMYHGADGMAAGAPAMRAFRARELAALRSALT